MLFLQPHYFLCSHVNVELNRVPQEYSLISFNLLLVVQMGFQVMVVVKNLPASAEDARDAHISCIPIPGLGRSPGGGNGNPLQYSCLEISIGRGAAYGLMGLTVHGFTTGQTWLRTVLVSWCKWWLSALYRIPISLFQAVSAFQYCLHIQITNF